jgi:hypothetical protein
VRRRTHTVVWPAAGAPLEPAHRAVGAHFATLEPSAVGTGSQLGQDRLDRLDIIGVDVVHERPGQELVEGVSQAAGEGRIRALQASVEPRDAKRIMRKIEEPYQLVIERPARLSHNSLVGSFSLSCERLDDRYRRWSEVVSMPGRRMETIPSACASIQLGSFGSRAVSRRTSAAFT